MVEPGLKIWVVVGGPKVGALLGLEIGVMVGVLIIGVAAAGEVLQGVAIGVVPGEMGEVVVVKGVEAMVMGLDVAVAVAMVRTMPRTKKNLGMVQVQSGGQC